MGKEDYSSVGGALKVKGIVGITKQKFKKKKQKKSSEHLPRQDNKESADGTEDTELNAGQEHLKVEFDNLDDILQDQGSIVGQPLRTEAERKFEETRRKRLDQKLLKEGVKSHKERVEEFNKYLSNLSEHHDMPRIGPG